MVVYKACCTSKKVITSYKFNSTQDTKYSKYSITSGYTKLSTIFIKNLILYFLFRPDGGVGKAWYLIFFFFFFFYLGFLSRTFTIRGTAREGEGIYLTPLYHFHPLHRHLDISRAITAESSPLHIAGSRTRAGNLCFPSASR